MNRYNDILLITDDFRHFKGPLLLIKRAPVSYNLELIVSKYISFFHGLDLVE